MKTVLFLGPSLPRIAASEILPEALILPPAEQGDVDFAYKQLGAEVIGLIDGVHSTHLPVWHKEILGALDAGCRVLGASSMGAIRAVECEPWGAEPVGEIASWYKLGLIDADDEVCLAHGDESTGYRDYSVPLVNIRATLVSADVPKEINRAIIEAAQGLFYPDRTWQALFKICEIPDEVQESIMSCQIDLKAVDAQHLCYKIAELGKRPTPARKARTVNKAYGTVFLANDTKVMKEDGSKVRLHQIAGKVLAGNALNRALALQFCAEAGIDPRVEKTPNVPDMSEADCRRLAYEELSLDQGRAWYISAGGGFREVPAVIDFLHISGMYNDVKEGT